MLFYSFEFDDDGIDDEGKEENYGLMVVEC